MNALILVFLFFGGPEYLQRYPENKEISSIIENLGHDDLKIRDKAEEKLYKMGHEAFEQYSNYQSDDLEIILRCNRLKYRYYSIFEDDFKFPDIRYLPNDIRFPLGYRMVKEKSVPNYKEFKYPIDLSFYYVLKSSKMLEERNLISGRLGRFATELFVKDLIKIGYDKEKIKSLVNIMIEKSKNATFHIKIYDGTPGDEYFGPMYNVGEFNIKLDDEDPIKEYEG